MNIRVAFRSAALVLPLAAALCATGAHAQYNNGGYPPQQEQRTYGDPGRPDWDAPPAELNDVTRRAYHDGIDAAQFAAQNNRPMNFSYAPNYRRPPVARNVRNDYRASFARGFQAGQQRMEWMRAHQQNDWHHDHDRYDNNYNPNQPH